MKRILTILALSLLCLTSNAQLVWKISGNGIKKPSYILGTHHGCPFTYCDSIPGLMKAFDKVVAFSILAGRAVWTSYNGIDGMRIIGPNGNSIFLPSGGYRSEYGGKGKGGSGRYWTSTTDNGWSINGAFTYHWGRNALGTESIGIGSEIKYLGMPIRAVKD